MNVIWLSVVTKIWGKVAVLMNSKKKKKNSPPINPVKTKNVKSSWLKPVTLHGCLCFPSKLSFEVTGGIFLDFL